MTGPTSYSMPLRKFVNPKEQEIARGSLVFVSSGSRAEWRPGHRTLRELERAVTRSLALCERLSSDWFGGHCVTLDDEPTACAAWILGGQAVHG